MDKLERMLTWLVNLSVLFGLGLLIFELSITNELLRLEARAKYAESYREVVTPIVEEEDFGSIFATLYDPSFDPSTRNFSDTVRLFVWLGELFRAWEVEYYYHTAAGDDERYVDRKRTTWLELLEIELVANRFDEARYLDPEFREYVNEGRVTD